MNNGNLLIVDDEVQLVKSLELTLTYLSDQIFTAHNGKEALEVLSRETIHCIISDINMPVMNGVQMLQEIRKRELKLPLIFYTAHGNHDLMLEALKFGAFEFLDKPNLDGLEYAVRMGLAEGTKKKCASSAATESQYQQLLRQLGKDAP